MTVIQIDNMLEATKIDCTKATSLADCGNPKNFVRFSYDWITKNKLTKQGETYLRNLIADTEDCKTILTGLKISMRRLKEFAKDEESFSNLERFYLRHIIKIEEDGRR